jgi:major vault protein
LVLPSGEYAYTRDNTSGVTFVRCGNVVVTAQAQDQPVVFDPRLNRFKEVPLHDAAQLNTLVPTGHYAVLNNPAEDLSHPTQNKEVAKNLRIGQRIHIPGPANFALWPRQDVKVIEGHQLRSNQYLLVRVYDEEAAKENWAKAVVKKAAPTSATPTDGQPEPEVKVEAQDGVSAAVPEDLSVGRLLIIRGTEVSFYIPPTGVEVVPDDKGAYVRDALTLERLQYCILIDESGNKRYVRGPAVVFPQPTERFHTSGNERRFRPIELNGPIQGIHIKVIAAYKDEKGDHGPKGAEYKEGDELFITGATTPIYFPCEQHSAVKYDGQTKHFATAIPAGDARYVLDRHSGAIKMVSGGKEGTMVLPDPRKEVFVRRVLTDAECENMYPGNVEVLEYNRKLREIQANAPTTRKGTVSEGELLRQKIASRAKVGDAEFADASNSHGNATAEMGGDEFVRGATYTEPRMVTLGNDKFAGVPKINPWMGYAVMVTDTAGNRRVEVGPKRVLLAFNETLEALTLSTGKPKTTDNLFKTAYLQVSNNKVADILAAQTADHVTVEIKVSYRVNFEGDDPTKWFAVANYVKLLCDHARSVLKGAVRRTSIEEFNTRSEEFIRGTILGSKPEGGGQRQGMKFDENNMRVYDVEVLSVKIGNELIQNILSAAQHEAVKSSVELAQEQRRLLATKEREDLAREALKVQAETAEFKAKLDEETVARTLKIAMARIDSQIAETKRKQDVQKETDLIAKLANDATLERQRAAADQKHAIDKAAEKLRLDAIAQEADATIKQLQAVQSGFSEALLAVGNQDLMIKIAEATSVQAMLGGKNVVDVIQKAFKGTALETIGETIAKKALPANGTTARA